MKKTMIALLATGVAFASCSKDDASSTPEAVPGEKTEVSVRIKENAVSRAEAEDIGSAGLNLGPGYLFFTDSRGSITRQIEIVSSGASGDDKKNVADFKAAEGATISNVPSNSVSSYLLSNANMTLTKSYVGNNISEIKGMDLSVNDMYDAAGGGVGKVPLWGVGTVLPDGTNLKTEVTVTAMGARLQLKEIAGGADIVSFSVEGIFINNYFASMPVGKNVAASSITDNDSDASKYTTAGYAAFPGLFDNTDGTYTGGKSYTPLKDGLENPVWAYNVFPNDGITGADSETVAHIVIRLKDVVYNDGTKDIALEGSQFLTVKGFKEAGEEDLIATLKSGYVYTVNKLEFSRKDITDVPEVETVTGTVTLNMIPWVPVGVDPAL